MHQHLLGSNRVAYGGGASYEEARTLLLEDIWAGERRVEIRTVETATG